MILKNRTHQNINRTTKKIIITFSLIIVLFAIVFALYDSPAKYVTNEEGKIYLDKNGEPILYYVDLFGNTFYEEGGHRVYAAVPAYIGTSTLSGGSETNETAVENTTAPQKDQT